MSYGLYIHIPFCKRFCYYCHFTKFRYNDEIVKEYIKAIERELKIRANSSHIIDSIYIGGGSPSLLTAEEIKIMVQAIYKNLNVIKDPEFTIETNPEDICKDKLRNYKKIGINRLSIGVQSFSPDDLLYLKRNHTGEQSIHAMESALDSGLSNINVDFIIGLPHQTEKGLEKNFLTAINHKIPHISAYILEGVKKDKKKEGRDHKLYFFTRDFLKSNGYIHYEVSNFCKKGSGSKHNLKYWKNKPYMGIGVSASGYESEQDYKNTSNLNDYFKRIKNNELPVKEINKTSPGLRKIVTGLRLIEGIPETNFNRYHKEMVFLLSNNFLIEDRKKVRVNPDKILLLNEILSRFF